MPEDSTDPPDVVSFGRPATSSGRARVGKTGAVVVLALLIGGTGGYVLGNSAAGPDVSRKGQVAYGCALAESIRETHAQDEDWGPIGEDPALRYLSVIPWLLDVGGSDGNAFSDLGWQTLWNSSPNPDLGQIIEATTEACQDR